MDNYLIEIFRTELGKKGLESTPELEKLWQRIVELRLFPKVSRNIVNEILQCYLKRMPEGYSHVLERRLKDDALFYSTLYSGNPNNSHRILPKALHKWPDGTTHYGLTAFECPPGKTIGYAEFKPTPDGKGMEMSIQGHKGADISAANEILGRKWYDVLTERIVESYRPLGVRGTRLFLHVPPKFKVKPEARAKASPVMLEQMDLPRKVKHGWFEEKGVKGNHPLNPNRKKFQALKPR